MFPQVYTNMKMVQGLMNYAQRLKGELVRVERDLKNEPMNAKAIHLRRAHYEQLFMAVQVVGLSLDTSLDWNNVKPKVGKLDAYRTERGDLRHHILKTLKSAAGPLTTNEIHGQVIVALKLKLSKGERRKHRAVLVDALHDLRRGPPVLVEALEECRFGEFSKVEQRWKIRRLR